MRNAYLANDSPSQQQPKYNRIKTSMRPTNHRSCVLINSKMNKCTYIVWTKLLKIALLEYVRDKKILWDRCEELCTEQSVSAVAGSGKIYSQPF